ncbi:MAG: hypothetical protein AB7N91_23365 [Candidatus Tectimicrobiota bacterium]
MSRICLCLLCLTLCWACQAPPPAPVAVRQPHDQAQADKAQQLLQRHDKLLKELRAVQSERERIAQEASQDYQALLDQCRDHTQPEGACAARLVQYREQYRAVITPQIHTTIAALLSRYFYEEHKYDAAIHEGTTYLKSGITEAGMVPAVLLYTALSHYNKGQTKEGHAMLRSLQEQYPASQEAAIVRHIFSGSSGK